MQEDDDGICFVAVGFYSGRVDLCSITEVNDVGFAYAGFRWCYRYSGRGAGSLSPRSTWG